MTLITMQNTVQQAASAITAAIDLETEIVDEKLMIIGGTGRYAAKIGQYEEDGKLDSNLVYATCLRNKSEYISFNAMMDPNYAPKEKELAEMCCPIVMEGQAVGLIGLIAFTEKQRQLMMEKTTEFITFLRSIAELISGKYEAELNNQYLKTTISSLMPSNYDTSFNSIIGESKAMTAVKERAMQVSHSDSTVLITGESGTGKDLLARAIHKESPRKDKPFVSINCGAIPEMLLESELFGYEKGSFTGAEKSGKLGKFQLADGGTIFLDEIGDMPLHLQVKLLSALQSRQIDPVGSQKPVDVDVRVIAATNKNLEEMIQQKQFRKDLYFRLNVIPITIPPLRERPEDIELLLQHSLEKFARKLSRPVYFINSDAKAALLHYSWPGNVREVENVIEYAINMSNSNTISLGNLPDRIQFPQTLSRGSALSLAQTAAASATGSLRDRLDEAERAILASELERHGCSLEGKRKAAEVLGISESTLYRRIRSLKL